MKLFHISPIIITLCTLSPSLFSIETKEKAAVASMLKEAACITSKSEYTTPEQSDLGDILLAVNIFCTSSKDGRPPSCTKLIEVLNIMSKKQCGIEKSDKSDDYLQTKAFPKSSCCLELLEEAKALKKKVMDERRMKMIEKVVHNPY